MCLTHYIYDCTNYMLFPFFLFIFSISFFLFIMWTIRQSLFPVYFVHLKLLNPTNNELVTQYYKNIGNFKLILLYISRYHNIYILVSMFATRVCCSCISTLFSSRLLTVSRVVEKFYTEDFGFLFDNKSLCCFCVCISLSLIFDI